MSLERLTDKGGGDKKSALAGTLQSIAQSAKDRLLGSCSSAVIADAPPSKFMRLSRFAEVEEAFEIDMPVICLFQANAGEGPLALTGDQIEKEQHVKTVVEQFITTVNDYVKKHGVSDGISENNSIFKHVDASTIASYSAACVRFILFLIRIVLVTSQPQAVQMLNGEDIAFLQHMIIPEELSSKLMALYNSIGLKEDNNEDLLEILKLIWFRKWRKTEKNKCPVRWFVMALCYDSRKKCYKQPHVITPLLPPLMFLARCTVEYFWSSVPPTPESHEMAQYVKHDAGGFLVCGDVSPYKQMVEILHISRNFSGGTGFIPKCKRVPCDDATEILLNVMDKTTFSLKKTIIGLRQARQEVVRLFGCLLDKVPLRLIKHLQVAADLGHPEPGPYKLTEDMQDAGDGKFFVNIHCQQPSLIDLATDVLGYVLQEQGFVIDIVNEEVRCDSTWV